MQLMKHAKNFVGMNMGFHLQLVIVTYHSMTGIMDVWGDKPKG